MMMLAESRVDGAVATRMILVAQAASRNADTKDSKNIRIFKILLYLLTQTRQLAIAYRP